MFLLINKPKGITSHDVVDKIRKITGEKKVGHAGTLDPMATGLLIVAVSRESTKKLGLLLINKKEYLAEITLGEERETDDKEGYRVPISNFQFPIKTKISEPAISKILRSFVGEQKQVPPIYSAIKITCKIVSWRSLTLSLFRHWMVPRFFRLFCPGIMPI